MKKMLPTINTMAQDSETHADQVIKIKTRAKQHDAYRQQLFDDEVNTRLQTGARRKHIANQQPE